MYDAWDNPDETAEAVIFQSFFNDITDIADPAKRDC